MLSSTEAGTHTFIMSSLCRSTKFSLPAGNTHQSCSIGHVLTQLSHFGSGPFVLLLTHQLWRQDPLLRTLGLIEQKRAEIKWVLNQNNSLTDMSFWKKSITNGNDGDLWCYTASPGLLRNRLHDSSALFVVTWWNPWLEPGWPLLVFAGVPELSGVIPRASQKGHGGEQPASEACAGAGSHAGRAEPVLGGITGDLLRRL